MIRYGRVSILKKTYKLLDEDIEQIPEIILDRIALRMNWIMSSDRVNTKQAALTILRDYRDAKLGRFGVDKERLNSKPNSR